MIKSFQQNTSGELRIGEVAYTLNTNSNASGRNAPLVVEEKDCLTPWDTQNRRVYGTGGVFPTLQSRERSGQNQQTVCYPEIAHTLPARHDGSPQPDKGNGANIVVQAAGFKAGNGAKAGTIGWQEEVAPTLAAVSSGLKARDYKDATDLVCENRESSRYIVRRLTPTECARLQGFPDTWGRPDKKDSFTDGEYQFWLEVRNTHAAINGKTVKDYTKPQMLTWYNGLWSDSAEYKMWGNGIALPCALYVMQGVAEALEGERA